MADEALAWDLDTHVMGKTFLLFCRVPDPILTNVKIGGYEFLMQNCMFFFFFFTSVSFSRLLRINPFFRSLK